MSNRPHYDFELIARDAAVTSLNAAFQGTPGDAIAEALELHRLAWEACLVANRAAAQANATTGADQWTD